MAAVVRWIRRRWQASQDQFTEDLRKAWEAHQQCLRDSGLEPDEEW